MQIIEANFSDFDTFTDAINDWELDFKLLSKNDFSAYLHMFSSETFTLGRTKIHGKIEQRGRAPKGFRSIAIPVDYNSEFVWLSKKVSGNKLLIFPRDGVLDGVSFYDFDVYVVSIEESMLLQILENTAYVYSKKIFDGDEQALFLSKAFSKSFHNTANKFLNTPIVKQEKHTILINNIIHFLLRFIEDSDESIISNPQKKKDVALRKAVAIINNEQESLFSVQQLCALTGVSERTLQYAFRDKYKVSPGEYIKAARLNCVKRELISLKGGNINISTVAGKYNFWHMGQFAKDFKAQFGILPSEV